MNKLNFMKTNATKKRWQIAVALTMIYGAIFGINSLQAKENGVVQEANVKQPPCPIAQAQDHRQQPIAFKQHMFDDGAQDLAVIAVDEQQGRITKRITYNQHQEAGCHFSAVAIARGGDWGWLMVWADAEKIYYTRLDGEALVFVPPKKLPISQVTLIEFLLDTAQPTMRVQTMQGKTQLLTSDDEGRNWQLLPDQ